MEKSKIIFFLIIIFCINSLYGQNDNRPINEFEERRFKFISEGFGFRYIEEEIKSIAIFIENHGHPIMMTDHVIIGGTNIKVVHLYYEEFTVDFHKDGTNEKLTTIFSKDEISYLYGIKHGMDVKELFNIIGEQKIYYYGYKRPYMDLYEENGNGLSILFEENRITFIAWVYKFYIPEEGLDY